MSWERTREGRKEGGKGGGREGGNAIGGSSEKWVILSVEILDKVEVTSAASSKTPSLEEGAGSKQFSSLPIPSTTAQIS